MQIELTDDAKSHLLFWRKTGNKAVLQKIEKLTDASRINQEHRYVSAVENNTLYNFL